jgi:hypothetical protein
VKFVMIPVEYSDPHAVNPALVKMIVGVRRGSMLHFVDETFLKVELSVQEVMDLFNGVR